MRKTPTVDIDGLLEDCTQSQGTLPTPETQALPPQDDLTGGPETPSPEEAVIRDEIRHAMTHIVLPALEANAAKEREAMMAVVRKEIHRLMSATSGAPWRVY